MGADHGLAKQLETQQSLTEWLKQIKQSEAQALQVEDNDKRERMAILNDIIGLPFDRPVQFAARDVTDRTPEFVAYLHKHSDELCALRLSSSNPALPKFRMRGKSIRDTLPWFAQLDINPDDYKADFVPHPPDYGWATIFMVTGKGMQGEIIYGGHNQLTQGFHESSRPIIFWYDWQTWHMLPENDDALEHLKKLASYLHVREEKDRQLLAKKLDATFVHDHLVGYFETADSSIGTWFIDYNRLLPGILGDFDISQLFSSQKDAIVRGLTGSPGNATGKVRIVPPEMISQMTLTKEDILVCAMTSPDYLPLMQQAAAIVTDQGGILSHASITARELRVPCIVGTQNATTILKEGDNVTVDADKGIASKT